MCYRHPDQHLEHDYYPCACDLINQTRVQQDRISRADEQERIARDEPHLRALVERLRANDRERIASVLGPMEREARGMVANPSTGPLWLARADALRDAAEVALRAGSAQ